LSGGIVGEASGDAGGLNLCESFCTAFSVNVFVNDLLRGLREAGTAGSIQKNKPKSQQTLSSRRDFHQTSVARCGRPTNAM